MHEEGHKGIRCGVLFRDKVLGGLASPSKQVQVDLLQQKLVFIKWETGEPKVFFEESIMHALSEPWSKALVIKLLG